MRTTALNPFIDPHIKQSKNQVSIMVFAGVANDTNVMPPHFIKVGLKINTAEFMNILESVKVTWIRQHYDLKHVMFIQDSAPTYRTETVKTTSKKALVFIKRCLAF